MSTSHCMVFSWSLTLRATKGQYHSTMEWCRQHVYTDVCCWPWYAALEVFDSSSWHWLSLCDSKCRSRGPSMSLWFCQDGFTTWYATFKLSSNVVHASYLPSGLYCPTQWTVLHYTTVCQCASWVTSTAVPSKLPQQCHEWISVLHCLMQNWDRSCNTRRVQKKTELFK
jgi:hypothetical protein